MPTIHTYSEYRPTRHIYIAALGYRLGVFKSFKMGYAKACRRYLKANHGRVITSEVIASLVGETWAHSITPVSVVLRKVGFSQ